MRCGNSFIRLRDFEANRLRGKVLRAVAVKHSRQAEAANNKREFSGIVDTAMEPCDRDLDHTIGVLRQRAVGEQGGLRLV